MSKKHGLMLEFPKRDYGHYCHLQLYHTLFAKQYKKKTGITNGVDLELLVIDQLARGRRLMVSGASCTPRPALRGLGVHDASKMPAGPAATCAFIQWLLRSHIITYLS